ncbi:carbohydrate-binding protein [Streptomyces sp. NBC_01476]|uniref:carbohydrate-binding protein n=1 Tax=Streptomyces sp. NBC_01476 TaxID=2903881 RepID=UPI002E367AB7|nr:carbohydrate-binding protein [Streptomyces sp. NBC_01476]
MTAGHDGTPENDDPFGYLYRSEGMDQPEPDPSQPRMPRTSYNSVQRVGERRAPQQAPQGQGGYGYPPQQGQAPGYGYPQQDQQGYGYDQGQQAPQYGAPQPPSYEPPSPGGHRGGQGGPDTPNRKGLLIGAVAVVAAVAIGIAFAMTNGSGDDKKQDAGKGAATAPVTSAAPSTEPTPSATPTPFDSKKVDASSLALTGGAKQSTQWPGSAAGTYVDGMGAPGASVAWTVTVPEDGKYTFFINYGNAGKTADLTLGINGKPRTSPVDLPNYSNATDWAKAWDNNTYQWVDLNKGANVLTLTCMPNTNCGVNLDQVWLKQGQVKK